jgi:membrane-bound lytic murein transglycosylase B
MPSEMLGSWAGAMGQCQFMPSSFLSYAVDYDGDGKKDIWNTLPDVFASIANYLKQSGWNGDETWGRRVQIPASMDDALLDGKQFKSLAEWTALGVRSADGSALPQREGLMGALTVPGKRDEPTYLIYSNYDVLLKWNRSRYFASAVGLLSDAIR